MSTPAQATIIIPASQPMVALLGPGDELLRVVEAQFPDADIHVRGNEMRLSGSADDTHGR